MSYYEHDRIWSAIAKLQRCKANCASLGGSANEILYRDVNGNITGDSVFTRDSVTKDVIIGVTTSLKVGDIAGSYATLEVLPQDNFIKIGGLNTPQRTVSGSYVVLLEDYFLDVTTSGVPGNLTFPESVDCSGQMYIVTDASGNAAINNITITMSGADTIRGAATFTMSTNYQSIILHADGSNNRWIIS